MRRHDAAAGGGHVDVAAQGDGVVVHDLGSQAGSVLGEAPLGQADVAWKAGQVLAIGATRIALEHPAADALAELERSPDERLRPGEEIPAPAEPEPEPSAEPAEADAAAAARPASKRPAPLAPPVDEGGWSFTDGAVVLMALGVLAISIAGLIWLLKG